MAANRNSTRTREGTSPSARTRTTRSSPAAIRDFGEAGLSTARTVRGGHFAGPPHTRERNTDAVPGAAAPADARAAAASAPSANVRHARDGRRIAGNESGAAAASAPSTVARTIAGDMIRRDSSSFRRWNFSAEISASRSPGFARSTLSTMASSVISTRSGRATNRAKASRTDADASRNSTARAAAGRIRA
ncbi:MAG: hypothetical protein MUC63_04200 [Planctomycetes bacterium]|nr:hypothetical protein [Planctomycetota bacterium]